MKKYLPNFTTLIPFFLLCILAGIFSFSANADSTITIPIPKNNPDRKVTLSLKIPAKTEPLNRKEDTKPALPTNRIIMWNANPIEKIDKDDEFIEILTRMRKKGWLRNEASKVALNEKKVDKYRGVLALSDVCNNIIKIGKANNTNKILKKVNLTESDLEDVRRMVKRFEKEYILYGENPVKIDKDLFVIQERIKKNQQQGILKVIKVEGTDEGATIIHMTVD